MLRQAASFLLIVSILAALESAAQAEALSKQGVAPRPSARTRAVARALVEPLPHYRVAREPRSRRGEIVDESRPVVSDSEGIQNVPFAYAGADESLSKNERPPESFGVFHCDFGADWDTNFDNWPDRWMREHSVAYPHYLPIHLSDEAPPTSKRSLMIELNGGAGAVHSPSFKVDASFTYVAEAVVKTQGLRHDEAYISITFLDANNAPLETFNSGRIGKSTPWTKVRIGPVASASKSVSRAVVTLHLSPTARADLRGSAFFSDVWVGRLPRMSLTANRRSHIYFDDEIPDITCVASGFPEESTTIIFELRDVKHQLLARHEQQVVGVKAPKTAPKKPRAEQTAKASSAESAAKEEPGKDLAASPADPPHVPDAGEVKADEHALAETGGSASATADGQLDEEEEADEDLGQDILAGTAAWTPPIKNAGFYRVRVEMRGRHGVANHREITMAVIRKQTPPAAGEFGWTLHDGGAALSLEELAEVLSHSGCNWCKFPLWSESYSSEREEQLVWFAERLGLRRIELVGLLTEPPAKVRSQLPAIETKQAAAIFSAPLDAWYPSLEPIMTRLSLKVRWWQLGQDHDQSFVGYPDLAKKIGQLKKQFSRYGQRIYLGMGWSWLKELPQEKPTWDFLVLSADPPLTWEEQITYLRATKDSKSARWVALEPLPREHYSVDARAADLAMRMVAAKVERAEGCFVVQVFHDSVGLMNADGTTGELFIPWRTVAHLLAGAEPLGSLELPESCNNQLFGRGDNLVLVLWNDQPTNIRMYLGEEARQLDLWGNQRPIQEENGQQVIPVGPLPTFISQVNAAVLRTQISVQMENTKLASLFGKPQANSLTLKNHFPQSIRGSVRILTPEAWRVTPRDMTFKLAAGETMYQQFEITLQTNAATGRQRVRLDFDISSDRRYQFSVYRQLEVGLSDIYGEAFTRLNERGDLEVEQRLTNETDEVVSFKCYLYAPGRKRMLIHVEDHGRGVDVKTFRLYKGEELIGKDIFLRAEEIDGPRILNYKVKAQR